MLIAAILLRCYEFNNPAVGWDEEFYLLVGDRMLHGAIPYVDIWDRKPVGLFLIYAGIRLLGGSGIIQYQIVASLFAATTAFMITRFASKMRSSIGAVLAGIVYLIWINSLGGEGGQSPVFYNLLTVSAAMMTVRLLGQPTTSRYTLSGALAMLVCGIDMQIKYMAVFECTFFGLSLLWGALSAGVRPRRLVAMASLWIGCALAPTIVVFLTFLHLDHVEAFWYANFQSILSRVSPPLREIFDRFIAIALKLSPLFILSLAYRWPFPGHRSDHDEHEMLIRRFVLAWLFAATIGFLILGTFFDHYALPLIVPLSIASASNLERLYFFATRGSRLRRATAAIVALLTVGLFSSHLVRKYHDAARDRIDVARLSQSIKERLKNCMYVYQGDPILYLTTGSCLPSKYAFASHLNDQTERLAVGTDQVREVQRIISGKPSVIVLRDVDLPTPVESSETDRIVGDSLSRNYHRVEADEVKGHQIIVYALNGDSGP